MSHIVLYFLHSTSVLSFYIDVVLRLSIMSIMEISLPGEVMLRLQWVPGSRQRVENM